MSKLSPSPTDQFVGLRSVEARPPVGLILGATIASGLLNYAYTLWLTELLPTREYSEFSSSLAFLLVVGTVANAAVPWVLAQELRRSDNARDGARAFSAGLTLNVILGALAAGACALLTSSFLVGWSIAAVAVAAFAFFVASTGMGWALGRAHYGILAAMVAGEVGVKVGVGIILVKRGAGLFGAIGGSAVGALAVILFACLIMGVDRRPVRPGRHFGRMLRSTAGLSGLQGLLVAAATLDVVLVEVILPAGSGVATYQLAATLGRAPVFVAMAIAMMVFPTIAGGAAHRMADSRRVFDGLALLLTLTVLSWAALTTLPRSILLAVAPSTYEQALRFLPVTAASGLLWSVVIYLSCNLVAAGRVRGAFVPVVVSATLGGVAMFLAGPSLGIWGFAIIELITALVALAGVAIVSLRLWGTEGLGVLSKCLLWLLAIVPLALLHAEPVMWTGVVVLIGASCVIVTFPTLRPRLSFR